MKISFYMEKLNEVISENKPMLIFENDDHETEYFFKSGNHFSEFINSVFSYFNLM